MAVDRGGLEYGIRVTNGFSGPLRQFRSELAQARRAFRDFRTSIQGLGAQGRSVRNTLNSISSATRQQITTLRRAEAQSRRRATSLRAEETALQRVRTAENSLGAVRQQSLSALQAQSQVLRQQATAARRYARELDRLGVSGSRAARGVDRAGTSARRAEAAFGGLFLTVRRLVTTLVFFETARFALDGVRQLIGGTIQFASALESAQLGAAGLFTAVGLVENSAGIALRGVEALNEAEKISADQLRQLRVEGLKTAATFDQLAETFQVAVAPGLQAGLTVDEIRQFTVQISQAASALGLEQRQLAEEIRSILTATQRPGQTRIADALGLSREDVRRATQAGNLFGTLQERFSAFSIAGTRALSTFNARLSNAIDALFLLSNTGAEQFFQSLKDILQDVVDVAVDINRETNELRVNPEAVQVFREIFDALSRSLEKARDLRLALDFSDLTGLAQGIAAAIDLASSLLSGAFEGVIKGASDLLSIFRVIRNVIQAVTGLDLLDPNSLETASSLLATIVRLLVVTKGIELTFAAITTRMGAVIALGLVIAAALSSASTSASQLAEAFTGIRGAGLEDVFVRLAIEADAAVDQIRLLFSGLTSFLGELFTVPFKELNNSVVNGANEIRIVYLKVIQEIVSQLAKIPVFGGQSLELQAAGLRAVIAQLETAQQVTGVRQSLEQRITAELRKQDTLITNATKAQIEARRLRLQEQIADQVSTAQDGQSIVDQNTVFAGLKAKAAEAVAEIRQAFSDLGITIPGDLRTSLKDVEEAVLDFGRVVGKGAENAEKRFTEKFFDRIKAKVKEFQAQGGVFNEFFNFLEDSVRRLTDLIADLIVDAFDPNTDVSAKERFLSFLRELAREAIRILIRIAIAKAAATVFDEKTAQNATGAANGGQVSGFNSGGKLGEFDAKARNFLTNFPVGFASGGNVGPFASSSSPQGAMANSLRAARPRGLAPSDTVPAWLTPEEWVIKRSSARMYGDKVMDAINRGMMDPFALRALAGASHVRGAVRRTASRMGYATGGAVSPQRPTSTAPQNGALGAVVVADDQAMERLLAGGRSAMLEFFADNAGAIRGLISS